MRIRILQKNDKKLLEHFLSQYPETSMFMRNNLLISGLDYQDKSYHGNYWGAFLNTGEIQGVLVHYWNGNIMMQCPSIPVLEKLIKTFKVEVSRPVVGILGENAQAEIVITNLNIPKQQYAINRKEGLYCINLNMLSFSLPLIETHYHLIKIDDLEKSLLYQWIRAYEIEALGAEQNRNLDIRIEDKIDKLIKDSACWALVVDNKPVSLSAFNARLLDMIQIGPVWTPPEFRNKGYARTLVALTLIQAQKEGITKAILFTDNPAAIKAYQAIGFEEIGFYRLAILKKPFNL